MPMSPLSVLKEQSLGTATAKPFFVFILKTETEKNLENNLLKKKKKKKPSCYRSQRLIIET